MNKLATLCGHGVLLYDHSREGMMRYCLLSMSLLFVGVLSPAIADNAAFDAKFDAEISRNGRIVTELVLTNRTKQNVCFFLYGLTPQLVAKDGSIIAVSVSDVDPMGAPPDVQVVWNDGEKHPFTPSFGLGEPIVSRTDMSRVAHVSYRLITYDCTTLFSFPPGKAPVLDTRDLKAVPKFLP